MLLVPPVVFDGVKIHAGELCPLLPEGFVEGSFDDDFKVLVSTYDAKLDVCSCVNYDTLCSLEDYFNDVGHLVGWFNTDLGALDENTITEFLSLFFAAGQFVEEELDGISHAFKSTPYTVWASQAAGEVEGAFNEIKSFITSSRARELLASLLKYSPEEELVWALRPVFSLTFKNHAFSEVFSKGSSYYLGDKGPLLLLLAPLSFLKRTEAVLDPQYCQYVKAKDLTAEVTEIAVGLFIEGSYGSFVECVEVARQVAS